MNVEFSGYADNPEKLKSAHAKRTPLQPLFLLTVRKVKYQTRKLNDRKVTL